LQYRLETEYGAPTRLESASWTIARWVVEKSPEAPVTRGETPRPKLLLPTGAALARDSRGDWVALFSNEWTARYFEEKNPDVQVSALPI
jgi:peptide chain release factor 3